VTNEEIVRRGFESFQRLDLDGFTKDWDPEVTWDVAHLEGWPGDRTEYNGTADVLNGFADYLASARGLEVGNLKVEHIDDKRVLGLHTEWRVSEGVEIGIGVIYELHKGKVTHVEVFTGHDQAREAAHKV
jgi:ketosteroid isomerase-like protein